MEVMIETCCGIDVHQKSIVCCISHSVLWTVRICLAARAISKNKVPLVSSNPNRLPAIENAWQGNPPQMISTFPLSFLNSSSETSRMSWNSISPYVWKMDL